MLGGVKGALASLGDFVALDAACAPCGSSKCDGAHCSLAVAAFSLESIKTSPTGRFAFVGVSPGQYSLAASMPGYSGGIYGQSTIRGASRALTLAAGDRIAAKLLLWPAGAISGRILDDTGDPVVGLSVKAYRVGTAGGHDKLLWQADSKRTNDQGEYRITNLPPDATYVVAVPASRPAVRPSDVPRVFPATFAAATPYASVAQRLFLRSGEERRAVDITLPAPGAAAVEGKVAGLVRTTGLRARLTFKNPLDSADGLSTDAASIDADGRFRFPMVPAGQYAIEVIDYPLASSGAIQDWAGFGLSGDPLRPVSDDPTMWAVGALTVTAEDAGKTLSVELQAVECPRIRGRVEFEPGAPHPALDAMKSMPIFAHSASGRDIGTSAAAVIEPDGRFKTVGLPAGPYSLKVGLFPPRDYPDLHVMSMTVQGREFAGGHLDLGQSDAVDVVVTMTTRTTRIGGVLRDQRSQPVEGATVVVFTANQAWWSDFGPSSLRLRESSTGSDGAFQFKNLPPGDYQVIALAAPPDNWTRPEGLRELLPRSTRVHLDSGSSETVNLKIQR